MNPDDPDNHFTQAISHQLRSNAVEKPKRSGRFSRITFRVEIAGVGPEKSSAISPVDKGIDTYANSSSTSYFFVPCQL